MSSGKEKACDEVASASVSGACASTNGHDRSVSDDHCVYSSRTSDALNDALHERPWEEEKVLE